MKSMKPFFEFWKKIGVRTAASDKHVTVYIRAFATILLPCLLQFSLVAHGQERTDSIDRSLMPLKCGKECVNGVRVIGHGSDLWRELRLVGVGGRTDSVHFVTGVCDHETSKKQDQRSSDAEKPQVGGAKDEIENIHFFLSLVPMLLMALWSAWR